MSQGSELFDAHGPKGRRRMRIASVLAGALLLLLLWAALQRLASKGQFEHDRWELFTDPGTMKFLLGGLVATLKATAFSAVLAGLIALPLALARLSGRKVLRWSARLYIEVFRAVPVLLLILFLAIGLPQVGIRISALMVLVAGLTLYNSAVIAEIFRAGILSLDRGQREAALALGQTPGQAMRLVVLPQALRRMVPVLLSQLLAILQDTSLGYVIPYDELLRRGQDIASFYPRSAAAELRSRHCRLRDHESCAAMAHPLDGTSATAPSRHPDHHAVARRCPRRRSSTSPSVNRP